MGLHAPEEAIDKYIAGLFAATPDPVQVRPEQTWDICRALANGGLLNGSDSLVSTLEVGPFRLAVTGRRAETVRVFLFSALPGIVRGLSVELSLLEAIVEALIAAAEICVDLSKRLIVIDDPVVWRVLLYVKQQNQVGRFPDNEEIQRWISGPTNAHPSGRPDTDKILQVLQNYPASTREAKYALVEQRMDGTFRALV